LPKTGGTMNIADFSATPGSGKTLHGDIAINPVVHVLAGKRLRGKGEGDILTLQFTMIDD